jgi:hypothetical protein
VSDEKQNIYEGNKPGALQSLLTWIKKGRGRKRERKRKEDHIRVSL